MITNFYMTTGMFSDKHTHFRLRHVSSIIVQSAERAILPYHPQLPHSGLHFLICKSTIAIEKTLEK